MRSKGTFYGKTLNRDCDGSGPCTQGEVKVLSSGGCANLILCKACFNREIMWRIERNAELIGGYQYTIPYWDELKPYR